MKIAAFALSVVLLFTGCTKAPLTTEQAASHMIVFRDGKRTVGECTATAVGPHALLTADHCDEGDEYTSISIDLSTRVYNIVDAIHDGRDHVIFFLDGPPFKNIENIRERDAVASESVYLYGSGRGQYPPRYLQGRVIDNNDPSDVDQSQGMTTFSLPVIPGDSGSAIYGSDGSIVAVTTYRDTTTNFWGQEVDSCKSFSLAFTKEDIETAKDEDVHAPNVKIKEPDFKFSPFSSLF